jgi:plasmid maintenance system antidote protein VapI
LKSNEKSEIIIAMKSKHHTLTELLRAALDEVTNLHELERLTGVQRASVARFKAGTQSLRLDKADILAEHFGITCAPAPKKDK